MKLRVLVACEYSGIVRDAFIAAGHDAMSCDLLPTEQPGPHYQGDVLRVIDGWKPVKMAFDLPDCECCEEPWCEDHQQHYSDCACYGPSQDDELEYTEIEGQLFARPVDTPHWDLMIAHPPCTYLSVSGIHWNDRGRGWDETEKALEFFRLLLNAPIPKIAIENPVGIVSTRIRKPDQTIQPYQFGADASKATCLWLKDLPQLTPTAYVAPRMIDGKRRWANQTNGGQNKLAPSPDRWKERSRTYPGIAKAMASQWGVEFALIGEASC